VPQGLSCRARGAECWPINVMEAIVGRLLLFLGAVSVHGGTWDGTLRIADERSIAKLEYSATIGNGFIGAIMDAKTPSLFLAGVFNGSDASQRATNAISHRAAAPNPLNVGLQGSCTGNAGGILDLQRAVYTRRSRIPSQGTDWQCHLYGYGQDDAWCQTAGEQSGVRYKFVGSDPSACDGCWCCRQLVQAQPEVLLEQRFYAHRTRSSLLVMEYDASWEGGPDSVVVFFDLPEIKQADFRDFAGAEVSSRLLDVGGEEHMAFTWNGVTVAAEPGAERVIVAVMASIPAVARLDRGKWYVAAASFHSSLDTENPTGMVESDLRGALRDLAADQLTADQAHGVVFSAHEAAWAELWKSGVTIEGRADVEKAVKSSTYYILSSLRDDWHHSLSPGGLPSNAYNGHTFWDTETWMYPPLLAWYPKLARSLLQYRVDRLPASEAKAKSYEKPFDGAMFAWESAVTGSETCPPPWSMGELEQHISADIAFAVRQYFYMTSDVSWLRDHGYELLSKVADFWVSKAERDGSGQYHMNHVVPPDEYADKGVDDSIYTNWVAKKALEFAGEAADVVGKQKKPQWQEVADGLVLLLDEGQQAHPEFEGYKWGTPIKQADVVLLPYPLEMPMPQQVRLNDLDLYAKVTDKNGPAMTWGMHAIGYIMSGKGYEAQAAANFDRSFANVKQPYLIWTETPTGGATNFITGAGGFLQTITFGYFGLRIHRDHVTLSPSMMEGATVMENRGLQYLGRSFTVHCDAAAGQQIVTLDAGEALAVSVVMAAEGSGIEGSEAKILQAGASASFPLGSTLSLKDAAGAQPSQGAVTTPSRLFATVGVDAGFGASAGGPAGVPGLVAAAAAATVLAAASASAVLTAVRRRRQSVADESMESAWLVSSAAAAAVGGGSGEWEL